MENVTTESNAQATGNQGTIANTEVKTNETTTLNTNEVVNETSQDVKSTAPITEEAFKMFKETYDKQFTDFRKEIQGRDKKISELTKIVNESKTKELTEEQIRELEKTKIRDEYHNLYVQQTIAEHNLKQYDSDMDFTGFFYSNAATPEEMNNEIKEKGKMLREYIDKATKIGIEKGVNERIAQGYVPKSAANGNSSDLKSMTKEQLTEKVNDIRKMPASTEKSKALQDLMTEQMRRMTE
jgi:hypothetical protein